MSKTNTKKRGYKIFIEGELINLCVPSKEAIELDEWTNWFNEPSRLQYTTHGIFPNTKESQESFYQKIVNQELIAFLICRKDTNEAFGTVSLSNIDYRTSSAEFAINIGRPELSLNPGFDSLEAMALITEHGFDEVGLNRLYMGQDFPGLTRWNKFSELIGWKAEGITKETSIRGLRKSKTVISSILSKDFCKIKEVRGSLWGSKKTIEAFQEKQPKLSFAEKIELSLKDLEAEHFKFLDDV